MTYDEPHAAENPEGDRLRQLREVVDGLRREAAHLEDAARRVDAGELPAEQLDELLRNYAPRTTTFKKSPPPAEDWRNMPPPTGSPVDGAVPSYGGQNVPPSSPVAWDTAMAPTSPVTPREPLKASTVISLIGASLIGAAALVFAAVAWGNLSALARLGVLVSMAGLAFGVTLVAHRRRYDGTAEGMAWLTTAIVSITAGAATFYGLLPGVPGLESVSSIFANSSVFLVAACVLLMRLTPAEEGLLLKQPRQVLPFSILAFTIPLLFQQSWTLDAASVLEVASKPALLFIAFVFLMFPRADALRAWQSAAVLPGTLAATWIVLSSVNAEPRPVFGAFAALILGAAGTIALYRRPGGFGSVAFRRFATFVVPAAAVYPVLLVVFQEEKTSGVSLTALGASLTAGVASIAWMRHADLRNPGDQTAGFSRTSALLAAYGASSLRGIPHVVMMLPYAAAWFGLVFSSGILAEPGDASMLAALSGWALAAALYVGHRVKYGNDRAESLPSYEPTLPLASVTFLLAMFVVARHGGLQVSWAFFTVFALAATMLCVYVLFHRGLPKYAPTSSLYPMVAPTDKARAGGPLVDGTFATLCAAAIIGAVPQFASTSALATVSVASLLLCGVLISRGMRVALPVGAAVLLSTVTLALEIGGASLTWNFFVLFVLSSTLLVLHLARRPERAGPSRAVTIVYAVVSAASALASTGRDDTRTYVCALASALGWLLVSRGAQAAKAFSFATSLLLLASTLHWAGSPPEWTGLAVFVAGGVLTALSVVRPSLVSSRTQTTMPDTLDGTLSVALAAAGGGALLSLLGEGTRTVVAGMLTASVLVQVFRRNRSVGLLAAATFLANVTWFFAAVWAGVSDPDVLSVVSGAISLTGGCAVLVAEPRSSSWVLTPGIAALLGYSLLKTYEDPGNLSRWTVCLLGGVALVAWGLARSLRTPFLVGSAITVLMALVQVGPWALDVPRWVLLLVAGVLFMAGGAKFEKVKHGYGVAQEFVERMR